VLGECNEQIQLYQVLSLPPPPENISQSNRLLTTNNFQLAFGLVWFGFDGLSQMMFVATRNANAPSSVGTNE
jgi:hypothetical protein